MKLRETIASIDEDYLIGLSNKGIVNRAKKDLEKESPVVTYEGEKAEVKLNETACQIVLPLGASTCSCPSSSLCRHIITAILWMQSKVVSNDFGRQNQEMPSMTTEFEEELSSFQVETLVRAVKPKKYNEFVTRALNGVFLELRESSIIECYDQENQTSVKLVSSLKYSTCSCRSKELCEHKALAILTWKIRHNKLAVEQLQIEKKESNQLNVHAIYFAAKFSLKLINDVMMQGLVRISDEYVDSFETAAVLCHNARMADMEDKNRQLSNMLKSYIERKVSFQMKHFYQLLLTSEKELHAIIDCNEVEQLALLLGKFKKEYIKAGTIDLIPIGQRYLQSDTGYEGYIYYFLNQDLESEYPYLSYSNLLPTFYESVNRKKGRKEHVPWGITCDMNEMMRHEIRLYNAKMNCGKLSSSKETEGEIIKEIDWSKQAVQERIVYRFLDLLSYLPFMEESSKVQRLVLICPYKCVSSEFDEIAQEYRMVIQDQEQCGITIKISYRTNDNYIFNSLEGIGKKMLTETNHKYVIFGILYIEEGQFYLYPIEFYTSIPTKMNQELELADRTMESITSNQVHQEKQLYDLLNEIQIELINLLQTGLCSYKENQVFLEFSKLSEKYGLLSLSMMLKQLMNVLKEQKNIQMQKNEKVEENVGKDSPLVHLIINMNCYIEFGKKHLEEDLVRYHMVCHNC